MNLTVELLKSLVLQLVINILWTETLRLNIQGPPKLFF